VTSQPAAEPAATLVERIHRQGPIRFGEFVEVALYGPSGFFTRGGGAGRAGRDFVTSPEVGPLFGACVARAIDREWERLGRPDPFVVVEAGAGNGRLAREVLRAAPACLPALRSVLVERSEALRAEHGARLPLEPIADLFGPMAHDPDRDVPTPVAGIGPLVASVTELPALHVDGVVLANELLDNLAFEIVVACDDGWDEIRIGEQDGRFGEVRVPAAADLVHWVQDLDLPPGTRLPVTTGVMDWVAQAAGALRRGSMIVVDYAATWDGLAARDGGWLRTYAGHARGGDPLVAPGSVDITTDVPTAMVHAGAARAGLSVTGETTQADWLRDLGIDALVAEGRAAWEAGAAAPDLAALAGRSRATEAAALTDPAGLGAHTVWTLTRP
jgi:NADH dehydrogenase [ubiquinone] 1 alpha subcomplex assembly factor 7